MKLLVAGDSTPPVAGSIAELDLHILIDSHEGRVTQHGGSHTPAAGSSSSGCSSITVVNGDACRTKSRSSRAIR